MLTIAMTAVSAMATSTDARSPTARPPSLVFSEGELVSFTGVVSRSSNLARVRAPDGAVCIPSFRDVLVDDATGERIALRLRRGTRISDALQDGHRYLITARRPDELQSYHPDDVAVRPTPPTIRGSDVLAVWEL